MSFLPGSHALGPLDPIALEDPADIFAGMSYLRAQAPVPCPLRSGSVTFHNGLTWHCAGPNNTDTIRKAYAIIFMPENTVYTGTSHVLTDGMKIALNSELGGEDFPQVG